MVSRLNNNFLVVELWSGSQLLGTTKLSTEAIHAAHKTKAIQALDVFSGRTEVVDLFDKKVVNHLDVSLRVGTREFIEQDDAAAGADLQHACVQTSFLGE